MAVRASAIALLLVLFLPGTAPASTLSAFGQQLQYTAAPGEINALDVRLEGTAVVFRDPGAPITAALGFCVQPDQHTVSCDTMLAVWSVRADLGDGDDRGTLDMPSISSVHGGDGQDTLTVSTITPATGPVEGFGDAGNDVVTGGAGQVILRGGAGNDRVVAGPDGGLLDGNEGEDELTGGSARETLLGGGGRDTISAGDGDDGIEGDGFLGDDADVIHAGPGNDIVQAGGGDDVVNGGPGNDALLGSAGNDRLAGDEGNDAMDGQSGDDVLAGGVGDDKMTGGDGRDTAGGGAGRDTVGGGAGRDRLTGGPHADVLRGEAGDDLIAMGPGRDRANAGGGDDRVVAEDRAPGSVACGPGEDGVAPGAGDRVHIDCETLERTVTCPKSWRRRCAASGALSTTGRHPLVLGRGAARLGRGATRSLRVPLPDRARTTVRRRRRVPVRLAVEIVAGARHRGPLTTVFSLHARLP
jgi:hemolysin type calcium-binding protein